MVRRVVKGVLFVATMLAAWVVAFPARAADAPMCDKRGAITFAPAPQLQASQVSLDDVAADDCAPDEALRHALGSDRPIVWDAPGAEPCALPSPDPALAAVSGAASFAKTRLLAASLGARAALDRPPRA